jgi:carbon storage regulator CsrA
MEFSPMLILSRKNSEELVFPLLGITIRVLNSSHHKVKLGVTAPKRFLVLRGEIDAEPSSELTSIDDLIDAVCIVKEQVRSHELRDRLNLLVLNLQLLGRLEEQELPNDGLSLIERITQALDELETQFSQIAIPCEVRKWEPDKKRLLVVDDNLNERELLTAVLTMQGFDVRSAGDGVEAIHCLNSDDRLPHAVLLDMQMPRLNGETTLRCIRTDKRLEGLKVIGISGNEPQLGILPEDLRGFDAWFSKPIKLDQLISFIHRPDFIANR